MSSDILKRAAEKKSAKMLYSFIVGALFLFFFIFSVTYLFYKSRTEVDALIQDHLEQLSSVFKTINSQCNIIGFTSDKVYVDFLNVKEFKGEQVGSLLLDRQNCWKGPYIKDNPNIQQKLYEIRKTDLGYFIFPGEGIVLSNGKIIGKNILFDEISDIAPFLKNNERIVIDGKLLGIKVDITNINPAEHVRQLKKIIEEINATCGISNFIREKIQINFLNIKSFEGSEIGGMNLIYPAKWKGPYLEYNPSYQSKLYNILITKDGHFIVPGDGVKLKNGKIIGVNLILNASANIPLMMQNKDELLIDCQPVAAKLDLKNIKAQLEPLAIAVEESSELN